MAAPIGHHLIPQHMGENIESKVRQQCGRGASGPIRPQHLLAVRLGMDKQNQRHRHPFGTRTLRRDIRPQGHRIRFRIMDKPGIPPVRHQGLPTPQRRRSATNRNRMARKARTHQDELPSPHRRSEGITPGQGPVQVQGTYRIRVRSGRHQPRRVRNESVYMEDEPPRSSSLNRIAWKRNI